MKKKAIIIIGGGYLQINQIKWAKELGLHVIVTDKNENCLGKSFADEFKIIDGTDTEKFFELIDLVKIDYDFIGCYSGSDFGLITVSRISEKFGTFGCTVNSARLSLNKFSSKKIWQKNNISTPDGFTVSSIKDVIKIISKIGFPIILKPIDSSGSRGVNSVWNYDSLQSSFDESSQFSNEIIIEKIITGNHLDVNGVFLNNSFFKCGIFDRFFSVPPKHIPIWGCTTTLTVEQENTIYAIVEKAARLLGITVGPVKADVIFNKNGPHLIELTPRFHGDVSTSFILHHGMNINPIKCWFSFLKQDTTPQNYIKNSSSKIVCGWMGLFSNSNGILKSIDGVECALSLDGIIDVYVSKKKGDKLSLPNDNTSLCGFIWGKSTNMLELHKILQHARSLIKFNI